MFTFIEVSRFASEEIPLCSDEFILVFIFVESFPLCNRGDTTLWRGIYLVIFIYVESFPTCKPGDTAL